MLQALASSTFPTEGYNAVSEKMPCCNCRLLFADRLGCIISPTVPGADLPSKIARTKCLAFHIPSDLFTSLPLLPSFNPQERIHHISLRPYVSTGSDRCPVSTLAGCLTDTPSPVDLHHGWFCAVGGREEVGPAHIALRQGQWRKCPCSVRSPLEGGSAVSRSRLEIAP